MMFDRVHRWLWKPTEDDDLVSVLVEGHARLRTFVDLAVSVGERRGSELAEDAARIERYFAKSFPLDVEDEETSILPRLRGRSSRLDAALYRMQEQHGVHRHVVPRICAHASALCVNPSDRGAQELLGSVARPLRVLMNHHLEAEERIVFAAVREHFTLREQRIVRREIVERRSLSQ